jgi:hypothetical protein
LAEELAVTEERHVSQRQMERQVKPIQKCLQTLIPLIRHGDIHGIATAQRAIKEYLQRFDEQYHQIAALHALDEELIECCRDLRPASGSDKFADAVFDCLDSRLRECGGANPSDSMLSQK